MNEMALAVIVREIQGQKVKSTRILDYMQPDFLMTLIAFMRSINIV